MQHKYRSLPPIRRTHSGSLYPLTEGQRRSAGSLIRHDCCNYIDGGCIALDCDCCPQMISLHILCRWFQECVLPLDPVLQGSVFRDRVLRKCSVCSAAFIPASPRSKYCPGCSAAVRRKKNAAYKRNSRGRKTERYVSVLEPGRGTNGGLPACRSGAPDSFSKSNDTGSLNADNSMDTDREVK